MEPAQTPRFADCPPIWCGLYHGYVFTVSASDSSPQSQTVTTPTQGRNLSGLLPTDHPTGHPTPSPSTKQELGAESIASPAPPASCAPSAPCPVAAAARSSPAADPPPSRPPRCRASRCPRLCPLPAAAWGMSRSAPREPPGADECAVTLHIPPPPPPGQWGAPLQPPKAVKPRCTCIRQPPVQIHQTATARKGGRRDLLSQSHPVASRAHPTALHSPMAKSGLQAGRQVPEVGRSVGKKGPAATS